LSLLQLWSEQTAQLHGDSKLKGPRQAGLCR